MGSARYSLLRKIGTGGMAEVWKARGEHGFVAIKKVLPSLSASRDTIEMLLEEARLVTALTHPNIVQVYDFGHDDQEWFIALEYVGGCNLNDLLRRAGETNLRIPYEVALYIALECCKALGFAHASTDASGAPRNLVHRDVSPHNILLSWEGDVKLTDFGIAKAAQSVSRTQVGVVRGKAAYLSPEQMESQPLDRRSDLFSLGLVLFELIKGRRFFDAPNLPKLLDQISAFQQPGEEIADLPREIRELLRGILLRNRAERFNDASHMETALDGVLGEEGKEEAKRALGQILQKLFEEEHWRDGEDQQMTTGEIETARARAAGAPSASVGAIPEQEPSLTSSGMITLTSSIYVDEAPPPWPTPPPPTPTRAAPPPAPVATPPPAKPRPEREPARAAVPASEPIPEPTVKERVQPRSSTFTATAPARRERSRILPFLALGAFGAIAAAAFWGRDAWRTPAESPTETGIATATATASETALPEETSSAPTGTETIASIAPPTATPVSTVAALETPRKTPTPLATKRPAPTPTTAATPLASPAPSVVPTTTLVAGADKPAHLWVSAKPWVEVWIDGKRVADETPLKAFAVPPGRHALRFVNPVSNFRLDREITLRSGDDVDLFVDTTVTANHVTQTPHR